MDFRAPENLNFLVMALIVSLVDVGGPLTFSANFCS